MKKLNTNKHSAEKRLLTTKHLSLTLSKDISPTATVGIKHISIRERILKLILGDITRLTILVVGNDIENITIYKGGTYENSDSKK